MKKLLVFSTVIIFFGLSAQAFNLNDKENRKVADKKSDCTTVVAATECGSETNVVLTAGKEKASDCSSADKAVKASSNECGSATNVVMTAGKEKASDCSSSAGATKTVATAKASDCGSPCGSTVATKVAGKKECGDEKTEDSRIAENK